MRNLTLAPKTALPFISHPSVRFLAIVLTCASSTVVTVGPWSMAAQQPPPTQSRLITVTVTDPAGRFVTGLGEENFVVVENGISRPITYFSDRGSPMSVAIVSESPLSLGDILRPEDELIQTSSLSDALRQLATSKNPRKVIVATASVDVRGVPAGIQVAQSDDASKTVIELRNQYLLRFQASDPAARFDVVLKQPRGLPPLKPVWKTPF